MMSQRSGGRPGDAPAELLIHVHRTGPLVRLVALTLPGLPCRWERINSWGAAEHRFEAGHVTTRLLCTSFLRTRSSEGWVESVPPSQTHASLQAWPTRDRVVWRTPGTVRSALPRHRPRADARESL